MKTPTSVLLALFRIAAALAVCPALQAAVSIVDTFDQGGFSLTRGVGSSVSEDVNLPLGTQRHAQLNTGASGSVTTDLRSTLDSSTGKLTLVVNGTIQPPSTDYLGLDLVYAGGGPHNIADCTGFILGFSEMSGVGSIYVELGSDSGLASVHRVNLTGLGDVFYPVSGVRLNVGHTLEAFNVLHFRFEARSTEFSFTLDEIRLVPEPSSLLLVLAAGAGLLLRRRSDPAGRSA